MGRLLEYALAVRLEELRMPGLRQTSPTNDLVTHEVATFARLVRAHFNTVQRCSSRRYGCEMPKAGQQRSQVHIAFLIKMAERGDSINKCMQQERVQRPLASYAANGIEVPIAVQMPTVETLTGDSLADDQIPVHVTLLASRVRRK